METILAGSVTGDKLDNGVVIEINRDGMDRQCAKCGYTIFFAQERYTVTEPSGKEEHYHSECPTPLLAQE